MSSKSRKFTNRSKSQELLAQDEENKGSSKESVHVAGLDIPDEVLHVPETETSPLRFILMILLVVVLLVIFVVPTAFQNLGRGSSDLPPFFSWERPGHGTLSFDDREVSLQAQAMQEALGLDFFLGFKLGVNANEMDRAQMARLMVLDQLALDAGIRVPDIDLGKHLLSIPEQQAMFGQGPQGDEGVAALRAYLARNPNAEPNVRRLMRIRRLIDMAAFAAGQASPEGILEQWESQHTELAFDYVSLSSEDFEAAARLELPDDEALEAWLMGLEGVDKFKREDLSSPERRRIELVSYREGSDVSKLLEAYPLPEGSDPEVLAEEYYNKHSYRRFAAEDGQILPFSDEAVKAACMAEAPVELAMGQWLNELKPTAADGADPGLLLASNPLGLSYLKTESLTRDEFKAMPEFENASLLSNAFFTPKGAFFTPKGAFSFAVSVEAKGPQILRVAEVEERLLPPFAEIKDKVSELWIQERAPELGRESLDQLLAGFEELVPEEEDALAQAPDAPQRRQASAEAFEAAISAAGYESQRRDWLDIGAAPGADPMADEPDHKFLNVSVNLKGLEENEVVVEFDNITKRLYLVRCAGRRPVDIQRMSPKDFEQYKTNDLTAVANNLSGRLDQKFLFENLGMRFSKDSGVPNPDDPDFGKDEDEL